MLSSELQARSAIHMLAPKIGSFMDYNFWLAVIGILLTCFFGFLGIRAVTKKIRSSSQNQKVGKGSLAIQSGRDTKINPKNE
jgi:hypothetical protein